VAGFSEEAIHASAMRIISIRPHSAFELRRKLLAKKGADTATVDRVMERLVGVDLINDGRFAGDYVEFAFLRKSWGMRKVRAGLAQRGIDRAIIEEVLGSPDAAQMEQEGAKRFFEKQIRGGDISEDHIQKISSKLISRGFGWDVISRVIKDAGQSVVEP
jgi:regulatory protein